MNNEFNGNFEGVRADGWATGWMLRTGDNAEKASVSIAIDGQAMSVVAADQFRKDLLLAGLRDPCCAFLYRLPDEFADGREHKIEVTCADSGAALTNSPVSFLLAAPPLEAKHFTNLVPNAGFAHWPNGAFVTPSRRMSEGPEGWLVDFWRGLVPDVTLSPDRPPELALQSGNFALRLTVAKPIEGYMRLIVPFHVTLAAECYTVAFGLRRTSAGALGDLFLSEVFLGSVEGSTVTKLRTIRRNLKTKGTARVERLPLTIQGEMLASLEDTTRLALIFEFQGSGELLLFDPQVSLVPGVRAPALVGPGAFEDAAIENQVAMLRLSPLWSRGADINRIVPFARQPLAAHPFVQIVVPIFNSGADVDELIASLLQHTGGPFEILLADDGSGPFTAQRLHNWTRQDPRIRILRNPVNLGYTANINRAMQATVASHVILLNSDTIVTEYWLDRMFEAMAASDDTAGVGPLSNAASWQSVPLAKTASGKWSVNPLSAGVTVATMGQNIAELSDGDFPEVPLLNGFCTLFRRDALEAVGWFDDATFPEGYGEENDLCLRLGRAGWKLRVADHAYVYHKKSRSFGAARRSVLTGGAAVLLRAKHPEVSIEQVENVMRSCTSINRLRDRLSKTQFVELAA